MAKNMANSAHETTDLNVIQPDDENMDDTDDQDFDAEEVSPDDEEIERKHFEYSHALRMSYDENEAFYAECEFLGRDFGDPDEILIPESTMYVNIRYPFLQGNYFKIETAGNGFTRRELFDAISALLIHMYETEVPEEAPCPYGSITITRGYQYSNYGHRCHGIGDLTLVGVDYCSFEGDAIVELHIDS